MQLLVILRGFRSFNSWPVGGFEMEDAARMLDHYKKSITDDPLGFRIMAMLLRSEELTEDEITGLTNTTSVQSHHKLLELYRAGYVRLADKDSWVLSKEGETILDRLEMTPIASASLVPEYEDDPSSSDFLRLYVQWRSRTQTHKGAPLLRS